MVKRLLAGASLLVTATLWLSPADAQEAVIRFGELDRTITAELEERGTPGAAIAIVLEDRVVYSKGFGVRSIESNEAVTPATVFRMGSTTKMFTAAALVTLFDRAKIQLEAPIGRFVKGLHPSVGAITAHQLLSHSSGFRDFAAPISSQDDDALARNVTGWKQDVFFTEPGRIYSYSSPGYWLAGYVAEQLHGKSYADTLEELLFMPLRMSRTTLRPTVAATYELAQGHDLKEKKASVVRPLANNVAMWPGGSIFSTVEDLSRFAIAFLNGGRLEGRQSLAATVVSQLPAKQVALPGNDVHYGYGLMTYETSGVRIVTHGGASRGYGSTIQMIPSRRFAVIVLANSSGETLPKSRAKAQELVLSLPPDTRGTRGNISQATAEELNDYAGSYVHAPRQWDVSVSAGTLTLRFEKQSHTLEKIGDRTFASDQPGGGVFVFVPGPDGRTEHLFMGLYAARKLNTPK